jgi:hypothetical protein
MSSDDCWCNGDVSTVSWQSEEVISPTVNRLTPNRITKWLFFAICRRSFQFAMERTRAVKAHAHEICIFIRPQRVGT